MNTECTTNTTGAENTVATMILARDAVRADVADSLTARGYAVVADQLLRGGADGYASAIRACVRLGGLIMEPAGRALILLSAGDAEGAAEVLADREGMDTAEWIREATEARRARLGGGL